MDGDPPSASRGPTRGRRCYEGCTYRVEDCRGQRVPCRGRTRLHAPCRGAQADRLRTGSQGVASREKAECCNGPRLQLLLKGLSVLSTRRLPSLDWVPLSAVPQRHEHYEGATTSHPRNPNHLFGSLPGPTRFLRCSCSPLPALPGEWRLWWYAAGDPRFGALGLDCQRR